MRLVGDIEIKRLLGLYLGYMLVGYSLSLLIDTEMYRIALGTTLRIGLSIVLVSLIGWATLKSFFHYSRAIIPLIVGLILIAGYQHAPLLRAFNHPVFSVEHLNFVLSCIATGLFEELLIRVYLFLIVLKFMGATNLWRATLLTSFLFGLIHLPNALHPDVGMYSAINQSLFAFGVGLLLQSLLIRFRNLPLVIVFHALVNYWGGFDHRMGLREAQLDPYTLSDFIGSFTTFLIFLITIGLPVSYVIIKGRKTSANFLS